MGKKAIEGRKNEPWERRSGKKGNWVWNKYGDKIRSGWLALIHWNLRKMRRQKERNGLLRCGRDQIEIPLDWIQ